MGSSMGKDRNKSWDLEAIADHESSINVMAVSEDESVLVTGSEDCTARLYTTKEGTECIGVLRGHSNYITAIGTAGEYVVTGSADNTVRKWEMSTCACVFVYKGHTSRVTRLICSPDFIISSSYDRTCRLWRFETDDDDDDACLRTFEGHTAGVYPICFIPGDVEGDPVQPDADKNSKAAEEGDEDNADEEENLLQQQQEPMTIQEGIHPLDVLITGSADGTARSWSMAKGLQLKLFKGHRGAVSCMAVDGQGRLLYTTGTDHTVREWSVERGVCTRLLSGHKDAIVCLQLVNTLLYTGSSDTTARCYITEFGDCTRTYKSHRDTVICLRFHGGALFTGCGDTVARAYDARSGQLKRTYAGHEAAVNCLAVIGPRLYTGASDGVLRVWDADVPLDEVAAMTDIVMQKAEKAADTPADHQNVEEQGEMFADSMQDEAIVAPPMTA